LVSSVFKIAVFAGLNALEKLTGIGERISEIKAGQTDVATYAPAGLTNPAAVRICQSPTEQGTAVFSTGGNWG